MACHHSDVLHYVSHLLRTQLQALRTHPERGQSAAEYLGVIVVVATVIVALTQTGIGDDIAQFLKDAVGDISAGEQ